MRRSLTLVGIVLCGLVASTTSSARCLLYEPAPVSLTGELTSKKVPGPPSYTSIARGDRAETIFILVLASPICVRGDTASVLNSKSHFDITEVQLALSQASHRRLAGQQVRASGTLAAAQSGHHRTPVVLTVKSLGKAANPAN